MNCGIDEPSLSAAKVAVSIAVPAPVVALKDTDASPATRPEAFTAIDGTGHSEPMVVVPLAAVDRR
ncbi:MAG: Uncharacterised protein [Porticoccaceae bacterium UBA1117]|nr:MAG: Uncharacterised protein [Porticoccaceae bacterium UBA1117]